MPARASKSPLIIPAGPPPAITHDVDSVFKLRADLFLLMRIQPNRHRALGIIVWRRTARAAMRTNRLKEIWHTGEVASNCWLSLPSGLAAEMLAHQGWDSLTIDMQHGQFDVASLYACLTAISTTKAVPLVRVAWNTPGDIMRVLDAGVYGVICPNIETREECERFVGATRYAPDGYRSYGPKRAMLYAGADYVHHANATILTIAQVESAKGLRNVAEIAATPGLDMIFVGPSDLGLSLGREAKADQTDPVVVAAIDEILSAAKRAGLRTAIYCRSVGYARAMAQKGFDLVTVTADEVLLGAGAAALSQFRA
jgi:4-hydroxy-2-oxoheptanedioate aldolase